MTKNRLNLMTSPMGSVVKKDEKKLKNLTFDYVLNHYDCIPAFKNSADLDNQVQRHLAGNL